MRAQSAVRGGGTVGRPPSCLPLLTCVLGGVRTTPLPPRRGEGSLLATAFAAFKLPWRLQLLPPPCLHCLFSEHTDADGGWEKGQTLLLANRRRRSRGLTKMAAAVSAATTTTTAATARYRYRRRGPSSRERQSPSELKQVSSGTWASQFPWQPTSVALLRFTRGWFPDSFQTPLPSVRKRSRLRTPLRI
ncbi:PREDICTED: uncharacterized protein LOC108531400 [Rhinopithecus bieti]|uniref:uncharacterized protein LOC108531400 n=1 Tax=Rhinopithecus bieti TaxID=61621 RepID=UPI00083C89D4|nr:PREDICTED: uncharacterized protein LOC108531400 [Rhinopithecus bieti]